MRTATVSASVSYWAQFCLFHTGQKPANTWLFVFGPVWKKVDLWASLNTGALGWQLNQRSLSRQSTLQVCISSTWANMLILVPRWASMLRRSGSWLVNTFLSVFVPCFFVFWCSWMRHTRYKKKRSRKTNLSPGNGKGINRLFLGGLRFIFRLFWSKNWVLENNAATAAIYQLCIFYYGALLHVVLKMKFKLFKFTILTRTYKLRNMYFFNNWIENSVKLLSEDK